MNTSLSQVKGKDWQQLEYITAAAVSFTQRNLADIERIAECFNEGLSEAFEDILKSGLDEWLELCDITDMADKGGM